MAPPLHDQRTKSFSPPLLPPGPPEHHLPGAIWLLKGSAAHRGGIVLDRYSVVTSYTTMGPHWTASLLVHRVSVYAISAVRGHFLGAGAPPSYHSTRTSTRVWSGDGALLSPHNNPESPTSNMDGNSSGHLQPSVALGVHSDGTWSPAHLPSAEDFLGQPGTHHGGGSSDLRLSGLSCPIHYYMRI